MSFRRIEDFNNQNPALLVLQKKGFQLEMRVEDKDQTEMGEWIAIRDNLYFEAGDPVYLLGLVAIWEDRGNAFNRKDDPDLRLGIINKAFGI